MVLTFTPRASVYDMHIISMVGWKSTSSGEAELNPMFQKKRRQVPGGGGEGATPVNTAAIVEKAAEVINPPIPLELESTVVFGARDGFILYGLKLRLRRTQQRVHALSDAREPTRN